MSSLAEEVRGEPSESPALPALLVDSDVFGRKAMARALEQQGLGPVLEVDSTQFTEALTEKSFRIAFWATRTLGEEGWAALRDMIANQTTPVVIVRDADDELLEGGLVSGANGFINKPISETSVVAAANHAIAASRRSREARRYIEQLELLLSRQAEQLAEALDQVKALQASRLEVMNNASHELKTPLTPIIGWSKVFLKKTEYAHEDVREFANTVYVQGKRLFDVIDKMLRTASLNKESVTASRHSLSAESVLKEASREVEEAGRPVKLTVCPGAESVASDRGIVLEALHHVIDNALKFSPEGAPIELSAHLRGSEWVVSVADRGPGVPEDLRTRIFECFFQCDSSSTREHGGLGLGLFISNELLTAAGGRMWVEDRPGGGASFRLSLPTETQSVHTKTEIANFDSPLGRPRPGGEKRVLVVDDDDHVRELMTTILDTEGYSPVPASSVEEARAILSVDEFSLVLLDVLMHGDLALNLLRDIGEQHPGTETIMVTGVDDPNFARTALHLGAFAYLMKPFDTKELLLEIEAALRQRNLKLAESERRRNLEVKVEQHADVLRRTSERFRQAHRLALLDDLTGQWNHRFFRQKLEEELGRAARFSHPLSLLVIDIDHFKSINDRFGHQRGDAILIEVGKKIAKLFRSRIDSLARYGGEEFALILPETGKAGALSLAERIRAEIDASTFETELGDPVHVTISVGIATFPDDAATPEALFRGSDWAMFRAKKRGRNCIVDFADESYEEPSSSEEVEHGVPVEE